MKRLEKCLFLSSCIVTFYTFSIHSQTIVPGNDGDLYFLQLTDIYFEVDAGFGGRITSFMYNDNEILMTDYSTDYLTGSILWHSPQSEWGWPPSTTLDSDPYSVSIVDNKIVLESDEDNDFNLVFKKIYYANDGDNYISIEYRIINKGTSETEKAAWEVTRVPAGGITFFPMGDGSLTGVLATSVEIIDGVAWYEYSTNDNANNKFFSDGSYGWFAHANNDNILFIKEFDDVPANNQAPGEAEIELWLNGDRVYIEIENQSEYKTIPAGDSLIYNVKWYLVSIPEIIDVSVGSEDLVGYVDLILGGGHIDPPESIAENNISGNELFIYHNLLSKTIHFENIPSGIYNIEIFDITGKSVIRNQISSDMNFISVENLKSGAYVYVIKNKDILNSGKLIIR